MGKVLVIWNIAFVASIIKDCQGYEYCGGLSYCQDGYYCCYSNTQCCRYSTFLTVGAIVGIVIGSIVFISCVIAVICCVVKQKKHPGMVVQPHQTGGNVAVISSGHTSQMYGQQPYRQPYGQPAYGQQLYGHPPPYGATAFGLKPNQPGQDMAYPPPPQPATY